MTTKVISAVNEFIVDWRKGDFKLPKLAALDAEVVERALIEYYEQRKNYKGSIGQFILDKITGMSLFKIQQVDGNYVIIWSSQSAEQFEAIINEYYDNKS